MTEPANEWEELFTDKAPSKRLSSELHLDLYNFDEPGTEESRYILTSPRSLEACSRFGIKPVELLHKSFEDFVEEFKALYDTNYSHDAIYEIYQEHDRQRLRKLRLCREERERITKDREREQEKRTYNLMPENQSRDKTSTTSVSKTTGDDGLLTDRPPSSSRRRTWERQESLEIRKSPRMTPSPDKELNEIFGESSSGKQSPNYKNEENQNTGPSGPYPLQSGVRTYGESSDSEYSDASLPPRPRSRGQRATWNKPPSSTNSSPAISRRSSFSVKTKPKKNNQIQRSTSLTNVASHLPGKTAAAAALMSEKDQRIIDLMLSRHEETERGKREKRLLQQGWDEQKRLESQLRKAKDKQKQTDLFLKNREKERKSIQQSWGSHQQQFEARSTRHKSELQMRRDTAEFINAKSDVWRREYGKQKQIQVNKVQTKKFTELERKRQQEERLRSKEQDDGMWRSLTDLTVSDKIDRASRKKNIKATKEQTKVQLKNELEKIKHAERKVRVDEQLKEEEHSLRQYILDKHSQALNNYQKQQAQREAEIEMNKIKKAEKVAQLKEQQKQLNEDLEKWQRNVKDYRKVTNQRAEVVATKNIVSKSIRAHENLTVKQLEHRQKLDRVKKEEELHKQEVKAVIDYKDQKTEMVMREKEEVKKLGRQVAHASQTMRDMIREQTLKSSFDKMDEQAQLQARVGVGPRSHQKNMSTLSLG